MTSEANLSAPSNVAPSNMKLMKILAASSALLAIGFHGYLLKSHYDLRYGEVAGSLLCDISAKFSCSTTAASSWSELLGVPMALWGILANFAFLFLAGWDFVVDSEKRNSHRTTLLAVAGTVAIASVVMAIISFFVLDTICPFCVVTYVLSIFTAVGAFVGYRDDFRPSFTFSMLYIAIGFGVAGFILNDQFRSAYSSRGGTAMAQVALAEWKQNAAIDIPETTPLSLGPSRAEAKMTIIEFADFRCIHCKLAVAPLKAFVAAHPDVRLEFYTWPLDGECNTSIQRSDGASCLLARTAWCANQKDAKGWDAHRVIFERFEEWKSVEKIRDSLESIATQIGASTEDLKACADSPEAKAGVEAQARLGTSLSLRGTPAIFVNGKVLPAGTSIPVLTAVRKSLLEAN